MKILIVSCVEFNRSGIPTAIMNNYRLFDHKNTRCDFVVFGCIDADSRKEIESYGDSVIYLAHRKKHTLKYISQLRKVVKNERYELLAVGKLTKIIIQAHNSDCSHSIIHKLLYPFFIKRHFYKVACSPEAGEFLFKNHKFTIIKNCIDVNKFIFHQEIRDIIRTISKSLDDTVFLHVGMFNEQKNHPLLIEIFEKYHSENERSQLWLIGDGSKKNEILELVKKKKLEDVVLFLGIVNNVNDFMMGADILLLPSLYESFGIVNIEAQATGLPCVVSDTVPTMAKLSELFLQVPLNGSISEWKNAIDTAIQIGKKINRTKSYLDVIKAGFDDRSTSTELMDYYKKLSGDYL